MAAQYSFVMKGLTKTYPGAQKPTLNNLSLQFYPCLLYTSPSPRDS